MAEYSQWLGVHIANHLGDIEATSLNLRNTRICCAEVPENKDSKY
jgi:hypothetical protein